MTATHPLFGRARELEALDGLLAGLPEQGGAIVLRGDPGIGKSALLDEIARRARERGMTTLRTAGVQSEAHLPFSGLHQLLYPVLDGVEELPGPQANALRGAFGMVDTEALNFFLVALATLELVSDLGGRAPVLLVIEDAHWLDTSTRGVLAFVGRRLQSDPVVLVAAARNETAGDIGDPGIPELVLEGLDEDSASALIDTSAPNLRAAVRQRLLEEAAGNPLALIELPLAWQRAGNEPVLPEWLPLTTRLEQAFLVRVADLPQITRTALLVGAINDSDAIAETLDAVSRLSGNDASTADLAPAVSASLIDIGQLALRFVHPLVRSAVHQSTGLAQHQRVHAALADVLGQWPDRQLWHRAASVIGHDEQVAGELERAAHRAQQRGAVVESLDALIRAAELTDQPVLRAERLLQAAETAFELGRRDTVVDLLHEAEPVKLEPHQRGRLLWLRGLFEEGLGTARSAIYPAIELAEQMRDAGDPDRALDSLLTAAWTCYWSSPDWPTRQLVVAAAETLEVADDHPKLLATLAFAAPLERGAVVIGRLSSLLADTQRDPESLRLLSTAAIAVGAFSDAARFYRPAIEDLREQGRLALLARALVSEGWASLHLGGWDSAQAAVEEAERLARETAQPRWAVSAQLVAGMLAAVRGEEDRARSLSAAGERALVSTGAHAMLSLVQMTRGISELGAGRHAESYEHLRRVFDPADTSYHPVIRAWVLVDFAEAASRAGHRDEAIAAVSEMDGLAETTGSPLIEVETLCARPLVADDEQAGGLFDAVFEADLSAWPFLRGRMLLAYGVWLRRQRQVAQSRGPLRAASEAFAALGAVPWAERAQQELRATGESHRSPAPDARSTLTAQELQIVQMAAAGLSNRDIGQKLFLSHRTVGSHLYRAFPKLGIASRTELAGALGTAASERAAPSNTPHQ